MLLRLFLTVLLACTGITPAVAQVDAADDAATPAVAPTAAAKPAAYTIAPSTAAKDVAIGSDDPESGYKVKVSLTRWGAGIWRIHLADYYLKLDREDHYKITSRVTTGRGSSRYPFAFRTVNVNGVTLNLQGADFNLLKHEEGKAVYTCTIQDVDGRDALIVYRKYELEKNSYDVKVHQYLVNRSNKPLEVVLSTNAIADVEMDVVRYAGDRRDYSFGYFNPSEDPRRRMIFTEGSHTLRTTVLDNKKLWPSEDVADEAELVWIASTNRYFTQVVHPQVKVQDGKPQQVTPMKELFPGIGIDVLGEKSGETDQRKAVLTLTTAKLKIPPVDPETESDRVALPLALYAGPKLSSLLKTEPYRTLNLDSLVRYEMGCTFCTFQWLARGLLAFMRLLHDYVVFDWGVAIIILVICVRLLLHPITKKAQINMTRMQKQMGKLKPEIEKLQKKYENDKAKLQKEMMALYREHGVNPAGMLGCLPMFLQMPIWVALYAMLYNAIELRHEPAFYGFFQMFGDWQFLADLSTYDKFIVFSESGGFTLPLIGTFIPATFNILPILMGVMFYIQQQFTTPPPADEQQAQQQKIMKFMMLLFPLFLYPAPSGLTLYILASSTAGMIDGYYVRKHIKAEEEAGTLFKKKEAKKGGFMDRIGKAVAEKQKEMEAIQRKSSTGPRKRKKKRK